ncbi:TATA element modulatory factor 1, partial [Coemansia guatemalensis]
MNGLFGGNLQSGAARQSAATRSVGNSGTATPSDKGSPGAGGLGGWGNMFKSALNQMETHLDRYLESPNEGLPADGRQRPLPPRSGRGSRAPRQQPRGSPPNTTQSAESVVPVAATRPAITSAASSQRLRNLSDTPQKRPGTPLRGDTSAQQFPRDTVDVREDDMDADLLDAFGVDLDDAQPAATGEKSQGISPTQKKEPVAATYDQSNSIGTVATPSTAAGSPRESTDNPYIQDELKKLRDAAIPTDPGEMRRIIDEYRKRIGALLTEGQEWSAKELRLSNTIKKLRADGKGYDKSTMLLQRKLDSALARNSELEDRLKHSSHSDRAAADAYRKKLEYDLKVSAETRSLLKATLTSAESEMAALRSEISTLKAQQEQAVLKAQADARVDADKRVSKAEEDASAKQQQLQAQVDELQQRMLVVEEESREREVSSLTQIRSLRAQLRNAEAQSREIGGGIQQHTLPLLQQIDEIQTRHAEQRQGWARKEEEYAARARESAKEADVLRGRLQKQTFEAELAREQAAAANKRAEAAQEDNAHLRDQLRAEAKIRAEIKQQLEQARENNSQLNARIEYLSTLRATSNGSTSYSGSPAQSPNGGDRTAPTHTRTLSNSSRSSTGSRSRCASSADTPPAMQSASSSSAPAHATTKKLSSQITSLKAQLQTSLRQKDEYSRNMVDMSVELDRLRAESAK